MKTLDIVANMKKAARDAETVSIGGGLFCPVELFEAANQLEAVPDLVAALEALAATARTFRNVPAERQEWTSLDDEALEAAFAAIAKAEGMQ